MDESEGGDKALIPVRIHDICDTFDGKSFPKDYLWTGWRPNCRCYMTPILVSQDDFADYLEARRAKRAGKWKPTDPASRQIDALPVELTNWVKANAARLAAAKTLPDFIQDNKEIIQLTSDLSKIGLQLYGGSLRQYHDEIFNDKKTGRQVFNAGKMDEAIKNDIKLKQSNGFKIDTPANDFVVIKDGTILKYMSHPKAVKGAVVPDERLEEILQIIKSPKHIYEDTGSKELVYICTGEAKEGKVIKVVIHPNYTLKKGIKVNAAKSWGISEESKMRGPQYRQIK